MATTTANTNGGSETAGRYHGATIAQLWDFPTLCVAIFGAQFHTPKGQELYAASGIPDEMAPALEAARPAGFLHQERLGSEHGGVLLQYWRSYDDLDRWARAQPHMRWWKWLIENAGEDLSFYHEIYQVKTAEAVFEQGCQPQGVACFAPMLPVEAGQGQSRQRQERFAAAHGAG